MTRSKDKKIIWAPTSWAVYEIDSEHSDIEALAAATNTPLAAILDGMQQAGKAKSLSFVRVIEMTPMSDSDDEDSDFFTEGEIE